MPDTRILPWTSADYVFQLMAKIRKQVRQISFPDTEAITSELDHYT
jgi:hypothetical protein